MEITKPFLDAKLAEVEKLRAQHIANANACNGSIEAIKSLLFVLEAPAPQPPTPPEPKP